MVALRDILVDPVAGIALRLADVVCTALDVDHRHPSFRKFKMIRPVERAELGSRFGAHGASLHRRKFPHAIVHARMTEADDFHILGTSPCVYAIDIDVGQRSIQRVERMAHVVLRAQQSLLFASRGDKHDGALRWCRQGLVRLGQLEQGRHPRRIVQCAVEYLLSPRARQFVVDAEMIPVRGVNNTLVFQVRIGTIDFRHDVVRSDFTQRVLHLECRRHPEADRFEFPR